MSLQAQARSALTAIMASEPEAVIAIVDVHGTALNGLRDIQPDVTEWVQSGVDGKKTGSFRCSAATAVFERGNLITVAGVKCSVEDAHKDAVWANWRVTFTERQ